MKYCLSPKEIPRAEPEGFPKGSGNISLYTPPLVTIQLQSIDRLSKNKAYHINFRISKCVILFVSIFVRGQIIRYFQTKTDIF